MNKVHFSNFGKMGEGLDMQPYLYMNGVKEGYGVDLSQIDYETTEVEILKNLTDNVYNFSAAKNYTQMGSNPS